MNNENSLIGANPISSSKMNIVAKKAKKTGYTSKKWSDEEDKKLESLLSDGITIDRLLKEFPSRTKNALRKRAMNHNYASTSKNGITIFLHGVKARKNINEIKEITSISKSDNTALSENSITDIELLNANRIPFNSIYSLIKDLESRTIKGVFHEQ